MVIAPVLGIGFCEFESYHLVSFYFFRPFPLILMFFFSPLEQFSINKVIPLVVGPFDFSITNSSLLVFVSCSVAFLFYNFAVANAKLIPSA